MTNQNHELQEIMDVLPGVGVALGAGGGLALGVAIAGAPGITMGLLVGSAVGLLVGTLVRLRGTSSRNRGVAPNGHQHGDR
jgi:hypothetical protein